MTNEQCLAICRTLQACAELAHWDADAEAWKTFRYTMDEIVRTLYEPAPIMPSDSLLENPR